MYVKVSLYKKNHPLEFLTSPLELVNIMLHTRDVKNVVVVVVVVVRRVWEWE